MTDTKLLKQVINESGLKRYFLAEQLGLTYPGLQNKIHNKSEFKASEIKKISEILSIDNELRERIFFEGGNIND